MNVLLSVLDINFDTKVDKYGVFFINWFSPSREGEAASDHSIFRLEYSPYTGLELELFGVVLLPSGK